MGIVKCPNGHFYNNSVFDQCPNCNADTVNYDGGDSMTVPVGFDNSIDFGDSTIPASVGTDALFSNVGSGGKTDDSAQTVAIYNKEEYKVGPVAGWLVCVEGPDKGKDFSRST